jgi:glucose-1-phosphate cytidylyltransferase
MAARPPVVLLAGGRGTRLSEETSLRPKPMVEIGGRPILRHIMEIYAGRGFKDFIVACGYKGEMIKKYFADLRLHDSDTVTDLATGRVQLRNSRSPDWTVACVDTGLDVLTGGRLLRLKHWLKGRPFMATYGDGVGDVDVAALWAFHKKHGKLATVTAVRPPARFGGLELGRDGRVSAFREKPQTGEGWINGGFFVFEPAVLGYLTGDDCTLEREPLERLAREGQLMAYRHEGFWQPMDTLRDKESLESLWASGRAPWA